MLHSLRIENLVLIREAVLRPGPGLNAITGETGAGKTILAQAFGLLLGARGEASYVGPEGSEAYVEAEFTGIGDLLEDDELGRLAELRPEDEPGLVLARRVFSDGRTRAYAWGRTAPREDVATAAERLLAMSGQFEQRRLGRASYQLDVLDGFCGADQLRRRSELRQSWGELATARKLVDRLERGAQDEEARLEELRALAGAAGDLDEGGEEALRVERERLRNAAALAEAALAGAEALAPEEGDGAAGLAGVAERALGSVDGIAPELDEAAAEIREAGLRLREAAASLRSFLASLEGDPGRLEWVEGQLERISDAKRRFDAQSFDELLVRAAAARAELEAVEEGADPRVAAMEALERVERRVEELSQELHTARERAAPIFAEAVSAELEGMGMGDGEFRAELREARSGPTGSDEAAFLIRPNAGLAPAPVAETASGGELSRIALAIAAVGGGETMVFDEIDAGIGGRTAHAVAATLGRLAKRAQVITITHLPQIANVAERHFRVEKIPGDPTHTRIEPLDGEARRDEIERMLGGREFLAALQ